MTIVFIILAVVMLILGILGSVIPGLPGPPLSWLGILFAHLSNMVHFSATFLIISAVVAGVITVLDYIVPSLSTKRHGGSKAGVWGCNIGLVISIIGLPFGPQGLLGIIFWPFIGALLGEFIAGDKNSKPMRAAWGAFVGFLTGTGLKLVYGIAAGIIVIVEIF